MNFISTYKISYVRHIYTQCNHKGGRKNMLFDVGKHVSLYFPIFTKAILQPFLSFILLHFGLQHIWGRETLPSACQPTWSTKNMR